MKTKLQVMICTHKREGLLRTAKMDLPKVKGVRYLISCQSSPCRLPEELKREDIEVHFTLSTGLSANRNNALSLVSSPYALIADDDVVFYPEGLAQIIKTFDSNPEIDIAAFMIDLPQKKTYPDQSHDLDKSFKNYNVASVEIAMRVSSVRRAGLWFNERLGAGTEWMMCGEEDLFLMNAKRAGLHGKFFPIKILNHPQPTTGTKWMREPGVLRAQGLIISLKYGMSRYPRLALKAKRSGGNILKNLYYLMQGWWEAQMHPRDYLI